MSGVLRMTSEKMNIGDAEKIVEEHTPFVKFIARREFKRLPQGAVSFDDLVSVGMMGLLDAVEKYDVSKGASFKTYAEFRIRGAMLDELRSMDWLSRNMRKQFPNLSMFCLDKPLDQDQEESLTHLDLLTSAGDDPEKEVLLKEEEKIIQEAIELLPFPDDFVIKLIYNSGKTMDEVGDLLDITESRISQIHARAINFVRNFCQNRLNSHL